MTIVRTAIFPVAGLGTRLLPATKSVPKELLPVYDTPLLQFAIDEAREAGVTRFVFVSHPSKPAIEDFVGPRPDLADKLRAKGKGALARVADGLAADAGVEVIFVMQPEPRGLGDAVLRAREHVLPGAVAVLLPDDLILGAPCIAEMARAYAARTCGHLVATMAVPPQEVSRYGILDTLAPAPAGRMVPARGMVEKPEVGAAPSNLAAVGRYVLHASIFHDLARTAAGAGGEVQLTDGIARGIRRVGLSGFRFSGTRYDCGTPEGLLAAAIAYRDLRTPAEALRAAE